MRNVNLMSIVRNVDVNHTQNWIYGGAIYGNAL